MATDKKTGERGHFVTLQVKGKDGKPGPRHVVFIKEGTHHVEKGHPSLKGKPVNPSTLLPHEWRKSARDAKVKPENLHQLATELRAHHKEYADSITRMLKRAREITKRAPHRYGSLSNLAHAFRGGDLTRIKGFDLLASQMRDEYPDLFAGLNEGQEESHHGVRENTGSTSADDRLYELLQHGNPRAMSWDEAYDTALRHREKHGRHDDDVPFAAGVHGGFSVNTP